MPDDRDGFAGRVAVVTGGSRGIGAGIAMALADAGARVVVSGRDEAALARVVGAITQAGGSALAVAGHIAREEVVQALRAQAERIFGSVSLLAACAGGGGDPKRWSRKVWSAGE
jgi:3-oxoacyl-[acyl-carrier protein] reductase